MRFTSVTLLACLAFAHGEPLQAQELYSVQNLGGYYTGGPSYGEAINASGQTTGAAMDAAGNLPAIRVAFGGHVSDPGTDLGTLGGFYGVGYSINASGQITGESALAGSNNYYHAFRTTATGSLGPETDLGTLGGTTSTGNAINDLGQVVGVSHIGGNDHAFRTTPTGVIDSAADLGTFVGGYNSIAYGINASGQVTGGADQSPGLNHAFRTSPTGTIATAEDLGTLGGDYSLGRAINNSGQVAGSSNIVGNTAEHAFRSSPNGQPIVLQDLGTLGGTNSYADGINALGVVIGASDTTGDIDSVPFVFDTQMRSLNDLVPSGWNIDQVSGINDVGEIVGFGNFQGGPECAVVLVPVPEPSTLALTALGALWLARRRFARLQPSSL